MTAFPVDKHYADALKRDPHRLGEVSKRRCHFSQADGAPHREGEILRQSDLARTYRAIAANGSEWFYRGPFAESVEKWMKENRGLMTAADLKGYRAVLRPPISTDYRGYTVIFISAAKFRRSASAGNAEHAGHTEIFGPGLYGIRPHPLHQLNR